MSLMQALCQSFAGTGVAAVVVAVMYATPVVKAAGAPAFPRAVTVPYLVTMLQVSHCAPEVTFPTVVMHTRGVAFSGRLELAWVVALSK